MLCFSLSIYWCLFMCLSFDLAFPIFFLADLFIIWMSLFIYVIKYVLFPLLFEGGTLQPMYVWVTYMSSFYAYLRTLWATILYWPGIDDKEEPLLGLTPYGFLNVLHRSCFRMHGLEWQDSRYFISKICGFELICRSSASVVTTMKGCGSIRRRTFP